MTENIIFGIDLGTTNTVVSYFKNNKAHILSDGAFKLIPSKIYFNEDNKIYCGNYIPIGATNIIHSFKVEIGKEYSIERNNKKYNINDILNIFINHIKNLIQKKFINITFPECVITVPSNFSDIQREIIRGAFISNGFNVIRIINEPSAAALAYGLNQDKDCKIIVFDTGGGTMDITVLEKTEGFFEIIHSIGLNDLGGNNFTNVIVNDILKKYNQIENTDSLFYLAQRMKEKLSYLDSFQINLKPFLGYDSFYELNYREYNKLCHNLLNRIDELVSELISKYDDINHFILVGGSSKLKVLQEKLYDITGKKPWIHPNLESVVCEGACLYGAIIKNIYQSENDVLLVDILPLSLGVATADGNFSVIVPKDTPLPVKLSQKYTTDSPSETSVKIKIYQGERKIADKNILIGEFIFDKVSTGGMPVIDISFKVDLNGIINVSILDKKSGFEKNILIKDIPKYDEESLQQILKDAEINNDADTEMTTKLQRIFIIQTKIENALINLNINELLTEEVKNNIRKELNDMEENLDILTSAELLEVIEKLDGKYSNLTNSVVFEDNENNNDSKMNELEKVFINELKAEIHRKATLLIVQNPDWEEFLKPLIDELSLNNFNQESLQEKLNLLKELQDEPDEKRDYREELKNICIYLKNEIEQDLITLEADKLEILKEIISEYLNIIEIDENNEKEHNSKHNNFNYENIDNDNKNIHVENDFNEYISNVNWEQQLNVFNQKCEDLY